MSKKYHMVKFFERKKIKKNLSRVAKKLEEASAKDKPALEVFFCFSSFLSARKSRKT